MSLERFEDIKAWQKARELTHVIYTITKNPGFSSDFRLRDQIRAAAASIMANIAEGFDSRSNSEFIRFLGYAPADPLPKFSRISMLPWMNTISLTNNFKMPIKWRPKQKA